MTDATVVIDKAAVDAFRGWNGSLGRSVNRLAKESEYRSKVLANRRTGRMADQIHVNRGTWAKGIKFEVGSPVRYAGFQHEGTRGPYPIRAKNAPALVFFWAKVGRVVAFKQVMHPGIKVGNPFLMKGVERAMRMWQRGG